MPCHSNCQHGDLADAMPFSKVPAQMMFAMRRTSTMPSANHQVSVPQAREQLQPSERGDGVIAEADMGLIPLPSSTC